MQLVGNKKLKYFKHSIKKNQIICSSYDCTAVTAEENVRKGRKYVLRTPFIEN